MSAVERMGVGEPLVTANFQGELQLWRINRDGIPVSESDYQADRGRTS